MPPSTRKVEAVIHQGSSLGGDATPPPASAGSVYPPHRPTPPPGAARAGSLTHRSPPPRPWTPRVGDGRLTAELDGGWVPLLDFRPRGQVGFRDGCVLRRGNPRVVELDVNRSVFAVRDGEQPLDGVRVRHVRRHEEAPDL